jgi:hypothetical protein
MLQTWALQNIDSRSPLSEFPAQLASVTRWQIVREDDEYMQMPSDIHDLRSRLIRTNCCWRYFTI